jgi:NO-binding membrane sensor protein with MHYT domain
MLSFSLSIPIGYDFALTCYSLVIAVLVSWFALHVVTRGRLKLFHLLPGGVLMGLGIAGMHYTGMAAANFPAGTVCGAANGIKSQWPGAAVIPFAFAILIVTLLLSRLDARVAFLANSVARLNDQIDRVRGPVH